VGAAVAAFVFNCRLAFLKEFPGGAAEAAKRAFSALGGVFLGLRLPVGLRKLYSGASGLAAEDTALFAGRQVACAAAFFALGMTAAGAAAAAVFGVAGFALPYVQILSSSAKRRRLIAGELPDFLDILTLLVESGCDLTAALAAVSNHGQGPLYDEMRRACDEMKFGKARIQALLDICARAREKHLSAVITSLVQSMKAGAPVGRTLRALSDQIRQEKYSEIEKQVSEAQVKMLFPIMAFIFPTIFIIIFGPIVLSFTR
jgi:tight adherence protein C